MDGKGFAVKGRAGKAFPALLLGCLCAMAPLAADPLAELEIRGLTRTKLHVAEQPLRQFIGREGADLDLDEVRAALIDTGILNPLAVEVAGPVLIVTVEEKWSLFPLPLFFAGAGGVNFGGAFMDANAFGLGDTMLLGGIFGAGGWLVTAMYMATPDQPGVPGWSLGGLYDARERRDTDQRERDIRRFPLRSLLAYGGLFYAPVEYLNLSFSLSYHDKQPAPDPGFGDVPAEGTRGLTLSPEISLRRNRWDGVFLSQESLSLGYSFIAGFGSPSFHTLSLRGTWERSLLPGFRLILKGGGVFAPGVTAFFESAPTVSQTQILPRFFSARHYAGLSLGLEKRLFTGALGTLSVLGAYQVCYSRGPVLGDQLDHGVAGSLRFYLSRVAIPALGLDFAYNAAAGYPLLTFSAGMSF
jgi:hypothetical protein